MNFIRAIKTYPEVFDYRTPNFPTGGYGIAQKISVTINIPAAIKAAEAMGWNISEVGFYDMSSYSMKSLKDFLDAGITEFVTEPRNVPTIEDIS